jgi:sulfate transport system substrate-binding protein
MGHQARYAKTGASLPLGTILSHGQSLAAKHYLRPRDEEVLKQFAQQFPKLKTHTVENDFGGWPAAQKTHFSDGGTFDQVYLR